MEIISVMFCIIVLCLGWVALVCTVSVPLDTLYKVLYFVIKVNNVLYILGNLKLMVMVRLWSYSCYILAIMYSPDIQCHCVSYLGSSYIAI